jgi:large subunit ribosomal protein L20
MNSLIRGFGRIGLGSRKVASPLAGLQMSLRKPETVPACLNMTARGMANQRHKKVIKLAKGYRGRANRCFTVAFHRVQKARQYAYRDRKVQKRDIRKLWIQRINASVRMYNYFTYSRFINKLAQNKVMLNRKVLADIAITEPLSFRSVVEVAKAKI